MKKIVSTLLALFLALSLVLPAAAADKTSVRVDSEQKFLAALGSDREVIVEAGRYLFDELPYLNGVQNLRIVGEGEVELLITSAADPVLIIGNSSSITLEHLTLGHRTEAERSCEDGVLNLWCCENVSVRDCVLFGCGIEGIYAYDTSLTVSGTTIRDCSARAMTIECSQSGLCDADFENCVFSGNGYDPALREEDAVSLTNAYVHFTGCSFVNNQNRILTTNPELADYERCTSSGNAWDPQPEKPLHVVPTSQLLRVDNEPKTTEIYNINDRNYFKLRDIAMLLNGTDAQFSIGFDPFTSRIYVVTGEPYRPVGGELTVPASDKMLEKAATAQKSPQSLYVDGVSCQLDAFNLGGNNFFALRDLGAALGFKVEYNTAAKTMLVFTN